MNEERIIRLTEDQFNFLQTTFIFYKGKWPKEIKQKIGRPFNTLELAVLREWRPHCFHPHEDDGCYGVWNKTDMYEYTIECYMCPYRKRD